jgi:gas vesicle protein
MHGRGNMAERYEQGSGGGGFTMGLVVGAAFGAVAAMLFAPKPGWEMRRDLADSAGDLGQTVKDRWDDVTEAASSAVEKGREVYGEARGTAQNVADSESDSRRF